MASLEQNVRNYSKNPLSSGVLSNQLEVYPSKSNLSNYLCIYLCKICISIHVYIYPYIYLNETYTQIFLNIHILDIHLFFWGGWILGYPLNVQPLWFLGFWISSTPQRVPGWGQWVMSDLKILWVEVWTGIVKWDRIYWGIKPCKSMIIFSGISLSVWSLRLDW